ncbi:hypothetical protein C7S13_3069 [Burkholderia cepacia]|nr:hypothetical protein [Burkholderia cepacia]
MGLLRGSLPGLHPKCARDGSCLVSYRHQRWHGLIRVSCGLPKSEERCEC